mgnify:CR=1 FL=1
MSGLVSAKMRPMPVGIDWTLMLRTMSSTT